MNDKSKQNLGRKKIKYNNKFAKANKYNYVEC